MLTHFPQPTTHTGVPISSLTRTHSAPLTCYSVHGYSSEQTHPRLRYSHTHTPDRHTRTDPSAFPGRATPAPSSAGKPTPAIGAHTAARLHTPSPQHHQQPSAGVTHRDPPAPRPAPTPSIVRYAGPSSAGSGRSPGPPPRRHCSLTASAPERHTRNATGRPHPRPAVRPAASRRGPGPARLPLSPAHPRPAAARLPVRLRRTVP